MDAFLSVFIGNELMSDDSIVFPTNRYEKHDAKKSSACD